MISPRKRVVKILLNIFRYAKFPKEFSFRRDKFSVRPSRANKHRGVRTNFFRQTTPTLRGKNDLIPTETSSTRAT